MAFFDRMRLYRDSQLIRLGSPYGGWILPKNHSLTNDSICYLAGAGEDISFDCELAERFGCQIRIIDPTPRAISHFKSLSQAVLSGRQFQINNSDKTYNLSPGALGRIKFLPVGLSDEDGELRFFYPQNPEHVSCSAMNLQKTDRFFIASCNKLKTLLDAEKRNESDLIKMDIEGSEYAVIDNMICSQLLPRILLIEFDEVHYPMDDGFKERIGRRFISLAHNGMRCIAVEGSNATFVRY